MKQSRHLVAQFMPISYHLSHTKDGFELVVEGQKIGRPSKRLTFHQAGSKVEGAEITYRQKQKSFSYQPIRINHLKSFEEVRLHTKELLYPGYYRIKMEFKSRLSLEGYQKLNGVDASGLAKLPLRNYFPSIDEPTAKQKVKFTYEDKSQI